MEDLIPALTRFHREIVVPDIERIVATSEQRLRDDMHSLFDALSRQVQELRTEYHMLVAGLGRVEERLDHLEQRTSRVEQRFDKLALRTELLELKARVDGLQEQIRNIEARLED